MDRGGNYHRGAGESSSRGRVTCTRVQWKAVPGGRAGGIAAGMNLAGTHGKAEPFRTAGGTAAGPDGSLPRFARNFVMQPLNSTKVLGGGSAGGS